MSSYTLKGQRNDFINKVDSYNNKYQGVLQKIKKIDVSLDDSDDTLLYSFLRESNDKLIKKIMELKSDVEGYKQLTIAKIDRKIAELERQEKLQEASLQEKNEEL